MVGTCWSDSIAPSSAQPEPCSRRVLCGAVLAVAALALGGCAGLGLAPALSDAKSGKSDAEPLLEQYRLEIEAPGELRKPLSEQLELARFQRTPASESVDAAELQRLRAAAPAQALELLQTLGYFNASVSVAQDRTASDGLPVLRAVVTTGPRATVEQVQLNAQGELQSQAQAGDPAAKALLEELRRKWSLPAGAAFGVSAWADAKSSTLALARASGYAAARYASSSAKVDADHNRVNLELLLDSGALFRLGAIQVDGLKRYPQESVLRLANFQPGDAYSEKLLLDYQERLQKLGLFETASAEVDDDPLHSASAAVRVRVQELPLQQLTTGLGYGANTGANASIEHVHHRPFGSDWSARNKLQLGPKLRSWEGELSSYPLGGLSRNLISGSATELRTADQLQRSWVARVGRTQDQPQLEQTSFVELTHARSTGSTTLNQADSVSLNQQRVLRKVDSVLLPTVGLTASAQLALGAGRGSQETATAAAHADSGPYARLYGRLVWYERLGPWYGTARVEAGQVFSRDLIAVPDTLLFRAGGDDSVRGYGYRTLGPSVNGATTSGRSLLTGSVEVARPIRSQQPAYLWAAFVDAGNAADRFAELRPVLGYGLGLRWRSPVGPLRLDWAYGRQVHQGRLHLSVGIVF